MMSWNCPHCGELHAQQFTACWRCGSDATGLPSPDSHVFDPHEKVESLFSLESDNDEQPPQLPLVTYYSIPVYMWIGTILTGPRALTFFMDPVAHDGADVPYGVLQLPIEITVMATCTAFISIPLFVAMIRYLFAELVGHKSAFTIGFPLSLFKVPDSIRSSRPWFAPVYYGYLIFAAAAQILLPFVGLFLGN